MTGPHVQGFVQVAPLAQANRVVTDGRGDRASHGGEGLDQVREPLEDEERPRRLVQLLERLGLAAEAEQDRMTASALRHMRGR